LNVPEGQPIPLEKFSEAVYLAEAPEHGANRCWCSNRSR
jgi:NADPH2:quinone reductase